MSTQNAAYIAERFGLSLKLKWMRRLKKERHISWHSENEELLRQKHISKMIEKSDIFGAIQDFKIDVYWKTNTNEQTISEFIALVIVKFLSSDSEDREPI